MVSYLNKSRSKTKRLKGGLALNLVVWLAMCPFKITVPEVDAVFEMGVSLKRMPQQSKLSHTLTLQIEKPTVRASATITPLFVVLPVEISLLCYKTYKSIPCTITVAGCAI